ncbi:MAG: flippase-like domain-containing protein [Bacteroidetes bacterium]|nr:flippase-like domain-containing protein [Bacteroidota bacterium]
MRIINKNIKILLNYGLGPILFVWLSYSIYHQVSRQPHLDTAWRQIRQSLEGSERWKLWTALLLMPVNWGLEARKWQVLLKTLEKLSWFTSFKAILSGVAFSINTPNRVGEYGGRIVYVQDGHRWKAVALTIIGSMSQLLVTLLFGLGGLLFLLGNPVTGTMVAGYAVWIKALFYGSVVVAICLGLLYFRLGWMLQWVERIPGTGRFMKYLAVIETLPVRFLLRVLLLSGVRYIVFVIQYILLLQLFGVEAGTWQAFWLISVLYVVLAVTPTITLAELGIRGQVSLVLFGMVSTNSLGIEMAATAVWAINLVLPAFAGSLLFLSIKIFSDK